MSTGHATEDRFVQGFAPLGKRVYIHRFRDHYDAKKVSKSAIALPQPADFLVVMDGTTFFAEVKEVTDPDKFSYSRFTKSQKGAAIQAQAAGGLYYAFIYHTLSGQWYRIPLSFLRAAEIKTFYFKNLEFFKWNWPLATPM